MIKYNIENEKFDLFSKNVILRVDFNVPIVNGEIANTSRIDASIRTIKYLCSQNAKVIIITHLGQPKGYDVNKSLKTLILDVLISKLSGIRCSFADLENLQTVVHNSDYGNVILLENIRFYDGEISNDISFAKNLVALTNATLYVNDAFSCSHREHASIVGIPSIIPSTMGYSMQQEIDTLSSLFTNNTQSQKRICLIVGGSKISSKTKMIVSLLEKVDCILTGGGVANSILKSRGYNIEDSIYEDNLTFDFNNEKIITPVDAITSPDFNIAYTCSLCDIPKYHKILDIGPASIIKYINIIKESDVVIWAGPIGYYENQKFNKATLELSRCITHMTKEGRLISVIGGGDTVFAVDKYQGLFTYSSNAGSAFLEFLGKQTLVGLDLLMLNN